MAKTFQFRTRQDGFTTWVDMPDVASAILERVIDTAFPGFVQALEDEVAGVVERAKEGWPRQSGDSADGLALGVVFDADKGKISGRIFQANTEANRYWFFIKSEQKGLDGRQAIQVLVREPLKEAKKRLKQKFPEVFRRRMKNVRLRFTGVVRG